MTPDEHLQQHLELCKRIYLRLKAEGKWPWPDDGDSEESDSCDRVQKPPH